MYLLDTNVVSELRKGKKAHENVVAWASKISQIDMFISVISIMELRMGILRLERKDIAQAEIINRWMSQQVLPSFKNRILPVDLAVANQCAVLHVPDHRSDRDALIAATAIVHGMTVVTRNIADFRLTKVPLLNPWED